MEEIEEELTVPEAIVMLLAVALIVIALPFILLWDRLRGN